MVENNIIFSINVELVFMHCIVTLSYFMVCSLDFNTYRFKYRNLYQFIVHVLLNVPHIQKQPAWKMQGKFVAPLRLRVRIP